MHCAGATRTGFLLTIVLVLSFPILAQDQTERPLTNADVVKMVNAGIPEGVVMRAIEVSGTDFVTTADALINLKQHHVPDGVMAAMIESRAGMRHIETPAIAYGVVQSPVLHVHHQLPNVDATVRLDSKTIGKVQVRKNEIKVEKAGVPLFSVTWKENPSK